MPGKRVARRARSKSIKGGLIGAAVVAVAVAAVLAVTLGWLPGSSSDQTEDEAASGPTTSAATASGRAESPSSTPTPDRPAATRPGLSKSLRACATSISGEQRAVDVAERGVRNWYDHVQARTDMLDGRISVDQMDAVWERTKAAGSGDQKRFKQALKVDEQPSKCARLQDAADSKPAAGCVQRSQAATRALDSAEAAMKDWDVHLANMRMFADKKMSATMAQDEWVKAWRNAPKNISAYRKDRAALAKAPTCTPAAS